MKKIRLLFIMIFSILLLTACGASVTSDIKLNQDGSGMRIISAVINQDDESYLDGGFDALEKVLKSSAPEGITVTREFNEETGNITFQIQYDFTDIEDYKAKTASLFAVESDATLISTGTVLKSNFAFNETDNLDSLIKWAVDAVDEAKIIEDYSASECYKIAGNRVYVKEEEVFNSSYGDPSCDITTGPAVTEVKMYTTYDKENNGKKEIQLIMAEEDYKQLDHAAVEEYLKKYSSDIKHDDGKHGYVLTLDNQNAMQVFFDKAGKDETNEDENLSEFTFINENTSLFGFEFSVSESFNMGYFLDEFNLQDEYVKCYLSLPEMDYNKSDSHYYYLNEEEEDPAYPYSGKQSGDSQFYIDYSASQSVSFQSIQVNYQLNKNLAGKVTTEMVFYKNGCEITEDIFKKFYKDYQDDISYVEDGETVTVTFERDVKEEDFKYNKGDFIQSSKSQSSNLTKKLRNIDISCNISNYVNPDFAQDCYVDYQIEIPENVNIQLCNVDGNTYIGERLKSNITNQKYKFVSSKSASDPFMVSLTVANTNVIIYIIIIGAVMIFVALVIITLLFVMKKKSKTVK